MPEQDKVQQEQEPTNNILAEDYAKAIADLRANSVSKEEYDKLLEQSKVLVNQLANGDYQPKDDGEINVLQPSSDYLKQMDHAKTNLDYITALCNYRDAVMKESGEDVFALHKPGENVAADELQAAANLADVLKQCVEDCDGDPVAFNSQVQRRFTDSTGSFRR